ncbi:hypothetical protein Tco_1456507 [Tanacetum coccineum]
MCRALGRIPTVGTFRYFYVNSISNGWLSFSKRGGAADPCCYSKKFDSLKNWNNHFFWIDASVCPLSTSWFSGTSVVKDPLPVDVAVDLPCVELLNENQMGLLDFVKSAHPFKVKVGERTLAENEISLITKTEDRVISPFTQTISLVDHNIQDDINVNFGERKKRVAFVSGSPLVKKAHTKGIVISKPQSSTAGKSPTALRRLIRQGEQAAAGSGSAAATEDITSSSVTPTLEHALNDDLHDNVRTRPPTGRFVVLSSSSADTDISAASQVVPLISSSQAGVSVPATEFAGDGHPVFAPEFETGTLSATPSHGSSADDFYESQTIDSATAMNVYVPNWNVTNNGRVDDLVICRILLDNVTSPGYWAALRNQKSEAAKVEELRKRVSDLEALVVVKSGEVDSLTTQNVDLLEKVSVVELERDSLKSQVVREGKMQEEFVKQQDAMERRFVKRVAKLDARIADVRRDMDNDLYPLLLVEGYLDGLNKGIQQGLEAGIVHGKAGRSLAQVESYDSEVEGKYLAAVFEFEGVSFPLLDELESLKDSPLALIMSALILKDDQGNRNAAPEFARFQPSVDQVAVPIYSKSGFVNREMLLSNVIPAIRQSAERRGLCPPLSSTLGEASGSAPPPDTSLGVTDYQVSTLVLASDRGLANQPNHMMICLIPLFWINLVMFDVLSLCIWAHFNYGASYLKLSCEAVLTTFYFGDLYVAACGCVLILYVVGS